MGHPSDPFTVKFTAPCLFRLFPPLPPPSYTVPPFAIFSRVFQILKFILALFALFFHNSSGGVIENLSKTVPRREDYFIRGYRWLGCDHQTMSSTEDFLKFFCFLAQTCQKGGSTNDLMSTLI